MSSKRLILFTQPRTASHLFEKMLSNQPNLTSMYHPFLTARDVGGDNGHERLVKDLAIGEVTDEQRNAVMKRCQDCFESVLETMSGIEAEGKIPFMHEHPLFLLDPGLINEYYCKTSNKFTPKFDPPYSPDWTLRYPGESTPHPRSNPLITPDDFLTTPNTRVIMPIRHPGLVFPSSYRAVSKVMHVKVGDPALRGLMIYQWHRMTYDWLVANTADDCKPILIDADDVMDDSRVVMGKLCKEVGLDADAVLYEWAKPSAQELSAMNSATAWVMKTLFESSGVRKDKSASSLVMEDEVKKWEEEFGMEAADWLKKHVEEQMLDYLYLKERRLRAD